MAETKTKKEENIADVKEINPMVTIRLPLSREDKEDVVVHVNNTRYLIKRGVNVEVPESVALIIEQRENMLQYINDYNDKTARF